MSYRERSYRKLKKAVGKANENVALRADPDLTRFEMNRVLQWSRQAPLPKADDWGWPAGRCHV